jgi:DNA invertase Pin-like site-specific DNA recombinase/uncharacterized protein (UPF0335 family)
MVAVYARQSIDKKDSISIESQIDFCIRRLDTTDKFQVYKDKGFSGKNIKRPAFTDLIEDIKSGIVDKIICYRIDRISRNILDFAKFYEMLEQKNIAFVSCNENFDTSTPIGKAMLYIVLVFAQMEREVISERIRDNYYQRGEKGLYLSGLPPLGYGITDVHKDGKKTKMYIEEPSESYIVKSIFNKYVFDNTSLYEIAVGCNKDLGVTAFTSKKLKRIIRNPSYVCADFKVCEYLSAKYKITSPIEAFDGVHGCLKYGKDSLIQLALHNGFISAETWLKAQYKLDLASSPRRHSDKKTTWLVGLMKCGFCNYSLRTVRGKSSSYIICNGRQRGICGERRTPLKLEEVESIAEIQLLEFMKNLNFDISEEIVTPEIIDLSKTLIGVNQQIKSLIDKLIYANENVTKYINAEVDKLENEKTVIENDIKSIKRAKNGVAFTKKQVDEFIKNWGVLSVDIKNETAKIFLDKIVIDDDITLNFNF